MLDKQPAIAVNDDRRTWSTAAHSVTFTMACSKSVLQYFVQLDDAKCIENTAVNGDSTTGSISAEIR